jgi:hypothetical protein
MSFLFLKVYEGGAIPRKIARRVDLVFYRF